MLELQSQLRQLWKEWLEAEDLSEPGLLEVPPPGNRYTCCVLCWRPLVIRTVSSSGRRRMGYPWAWIRYRGLPMSWPLENAPWEASLAWVPNYGSVEEHREFAKAKFEEDVEEGLMAKMSLGDFLDHYGIHTAIAALAVIVEDEAKDKKRIIHDATHGVRVNHRIKCRDKLRSPGAREKKHLLREHEQAGRWPSR